MTERFPAKNTEGLAFLMPDGKPHQKARFEKPSIYPNRFSVPDSKVSWDVHYPDYHPPYFTAPQTRAQDRNVKQGGLADPEDVSHIDQSAIKSYEGNVRFDGIGRPLNPKGRTGIAGRGLLWKWGPNFAADPIITRFNTKKGTIEMLAIRRADSGKLAIPGGMVDRGEAAPQALIRELEEETGLHLDMSDAVTIYKGYVDDWRTTDHAWIETLAKHKHLTSREMATLGELKASKEGEPEWLPLNIATIHQLYASHGDIVRKALHSFLRRKKNVLSQDALVSLRALLSP